MNQHKAPAQPAPSGADEWPLPSRFLRAGKHTIHYIDTGQGPTILFVQTAAWSLIWRDVITQLRSSFRCVALDFPGTGRSSPASPDDIRLETYARPLEEVSSQLSLTDLTLVLHDLGGPVGLSFASRHPDRIRGLVMTQAFGWPPEAAALRVALRVMGSSPVRAFGAVTNIVARASAGNFGVGRHLTPAGRSLFLSVYADRTKRRSLHYQLRDAVRGTGLFSAAEQAIRGPLAGKPMLTIFGAKNDPFGFQQRWKELFPGAIEYVVDGGHHFPMCDDPELFARALRDFIT